MPEPNHAPPAPPVPPRGVVGLWSRLGKARWLGVVALALPPLGGFLLLGFMNQVAPWLQEHRSTGLAIYVTGFVVLAGLALLPTYAQAILGGFAFGMVAGGGAALAGFTGAAVLAYVVARRVAGRNVVEALESDARWRAVYEALLRGGFARTLGVVTLVRLPPNSPFALTNAVLAGCRVALGPYVLGTALGMAPRTLAAVYLGQGLERFDPSNRGGTVWLIAGLGVTVGVVVVLGAAANRALRSLAQTPAAGP